MLPFAVGRTPRRRRPTGNEAFRHARDEHDWSRGELADYATKLAAMRGYEWACTEEYIREVEVNDARPESWRRELFCDLFELPAQGLGFPSPPAVLTRHPVHGSLSIEVSALITGAFDPVNSDGMRRRELAKVLALLAGGAALGRVDVERVAAILAGLQPDGRALDGLETLTEDLIRREATLDPQVLFPEVRGHLQGIQDVLAWTPPSMVSRVSSLAGQTALLAGYLMFKQERLTDADTFWSIADHLGERAGDVKLRGVTLQLQSWRWEDENPSLSLVLLNHSESLLGSQPDHASAALLLTRRALRNAPMSQVDPSHVTTVMRDIDTAQYHLTSLGTNAKRLYIFENVAHEAATMRALALAALPSTKRREEAAADLERIFGSIPLDSLSWRAYMAADLATARASIGDPEGAANLLSSALQYAAQANALRCMRWVRTCSHQVRSNHGTLPAVRRLDEQILALPLASGPHS
jgi:hypothetical protein